MKRSAVVVISLFVLLSSPASSQETIAYIRGNADGNGRVSLADVMRIQFRLWASALPVPCRLTADANGDRVVDISDTIFLFNHLFRAGPKPGGPFPDCGRPST